MLSEEHKPTLVPSAKQSVIPKEISAIKNALLSSREAEHATAHPAPMSVVADTGTGLHTNAKLEEPPALTSPSIGAPADTAQEDKLAAPAAGNGERAPASTLPVPVFVLPDDLNQLLGNLRAKLDPEYVDKLEEKMLVRLKCKDLSLYRSIFSLKTFSWTNTIEFLNDTAKELASCFILFTALGLDIAGLSVASVVGLIYVILLAVKLHEAKQQEEIVKVLVQVVIESAEFEEIKEYKTILDEAKAEASSAVEWMQFIFVMLSLILKIGVGIGVKYTFNLLGEVKPSNELYKEPRVYLAILLSLLAGNWFESLLNKAFGMDKIDPMWNVLAGLIYQSNMKRGIGKTNPLAETQAVCAELFGLLNKREEAHGSDVGEPMEGAEAESHTVEDRPREAIMVSATQNQTSSTSSGPTNLA